MIRFRIWFWGFAFDALRWHARLSWWCIENMAAAETDYHTKRIRRILRESGRQ